MSLPKFKPELLFLLLNSKGSLSRVEIDCSSTDQAYTGQHQEDAGVRWGVGACGYPAPERCLYKSSRDSWWGYRPGVHGIEGKAKGGVLDQPGEEKGKRGANKITWHKLGGWRSLIQPSAWSGLFQAACHYCNSFRGGDNVNCSLSLASDQPYGKKIFFS